MNDENNNKEKGSTKGMLSFNEKRPQVVKKLSLNKHGKISV